MQINNGVSNIRFTANVSEQVMYQLKRQAAANRSSVQTNKALQEQLQRVKTWGSKDSEIIITKNRYGYYRLGLKLSYTDKISRSCAFEDLPARTELSQFLRLKLSHIQKAEKTLTQMLRKYKSL